MIKITAEPLRVNFVAWGESKEQRPSLKYSGFHIDNMLKLKDHIKAVASRVSQAMAVIRLAKKFIPRHTPIMLY